MMDRKSSWLETPAGLRARAQWFRDWAAVCSSDNTVYRHLADHFDRLAETHESERLR